VNKYRVWDQDNDEESNATERESSTAELAAHEHCDDDCDGQSEGYYMGNTDATAPVICVRHIATGTLSRFRIYCEYSPTFTAYEIEETTQP
jgi:hypothetical protein